MSIVECTVYSNQLNETVKGIKIIDVIVNHKPHTFVWFALNPLDAYCGSARSNEIALKYRLYLCDQSILHADAKNGAYGTYTFLYMGNRVLMFNGMAVLYHTNGAKRPGRHQLLLELEDGTAISFCSSLGGPLFLFEVDDKGDPIGYSNDFPSLLSDEFSIDFFTSLVINTEFREMSAKAFLATKNRIPGLDNSILHEILWEAGINPKTKMKALGDEDFLQMYHAIKKVLPAVISNRGKDTDKDLHGNLGGYTTHVSKNTLGNPCIRCGYIVRKESYLGGSVYYCPNCQPLLI
ncbi:MAG: glycosylase/AP lyase, DNA-binding [Anaerocolumna sp.]|jgi:formamidopyrimidine-DNA glycosylase|nr:glycosylase/AP lyase, DNA-binding [Anaerocolumna sp.]